LDLNLSIQYQGLIKEACGFFEVAYLTGVVGIQFGAELGAATVFQPHF